MEYTNRVFVELKKLSKFETAKDIEDFEKIVWDLGKSNDPKVIKNLISLFDDDYLYNEVMYSLVHAIEQCDKELYVPIVIEKIPEGINKYPLWLDALCNRILNDESYRDIFKRNLALVDKASLLRLLDVMSKESPHHAANIEEIKVLLTMSY